MKLIIFWTLVLACSCTPQERSFKSFPAGPIKHHLIAVAKTKDGVQARGFAHATHPKSMVVLSASNKKTSTVSNDDGSFSLALASIQHEKNATLSITSEGLTHNTNYDVKDLEQALKNIVHSPISTGKEIDAIAFKEGEAALLSSQASLVQTFKLNHYFQLATKPTHATLLSMPEDEGLVPRTLKYVADNLVVTLFATHNFATLDKNHAIKRTMLRDSSDQPIIFTVDPPLHVKHPIDACQNGIKTSFIKKTMARNAEAVMAIDEKHILVSFVNYYQFDDAASLQKSVVGPGIVAVFSHENGRFRAKTHSLMPCKNPNLFLKQGKDFWVFCAGSFAFENSAISSTEAGLVRLALSDNFKSLSPAHHVSLSGFNPGQPAFVGHKVVIPHLYQPELAVLDDTAKTIDAAARFTMDSHQNAHFTAAKPWCDDVVFLLDASGTLIAYGIKDGFLPFPFIYPIALEPDFAKPALVPLDLHFRHQVLPEENPQGLSGYVTTSAHRLYPLEFSAVFGP